MLKMLSYRFSIGITQLYLYSLTAQCQKAKPHWLIQLTNITNIGLTNFIFCHMDLHCKPIVMATSKRKWSVLHGSVLTTSHAKLV